MSFITKAKQQLTNALTGGRRYSSRKERMEATFNAEDDSTPPGSPSSTKQGLAGNNSFASVSSASGTHANASFGNSSQLVSNTSMTSPGPATPYNSRTNRPQRTPTKSTEMSSHDAAIMDTITQDIVNIGELRKLCWGGCPHDVRLDCWLLLSGYAPADQQTRESVMERKRSEYGVYVKSNYDKFDWDAALSAEGSVDAAVGAEDVSILKQIRKDIPRTTHPFPILDGPRGHLLLERAIFIWAKRHPACGYVQGMLDIILPFCFVVLANQLSDMRVSQLLSIKESEAEALLAAQLTDESWMKIEADFFWLSSYLLGNLQENFTFDQAAAHAMVKKLDSVMRSIDPALTKHIEANSITFPDFAFRWMNCLLLRELSPIQGLRLYDTYMSEEGRFCDLHVYVCASLMQKWSGQMRKEQDYGQLMQLLQKPPTFYLSERDMDETISQAYLHQQVFESAPRHLNQQKKK